MRPYCKAFLNRFVPNSFNSASDFLRYRGFSIIIPSGSVANFSKPTSMPTDSPVLDRYSGSISQVKQTYHLSISRLMVQVLIAPWIVRCNLILIFRKAFLIKTAEDSVSVIWRVYSQVRPTN